jgi:polysaccharide deacetylase family protein (PEP-CTERM system associated)
MGNVKHHFTVDVEEYFHVSAMEPYVPRETWPSMESRMEPGMSRLSELLDETGTRGTFFVLGVVAERHPGMVKALAAAGHEVASHGWDHRRVTHLEPEAFRQQARDSRAFLEDLTGSRVLGFRAPSFSILPGMEWALEILLEEGYRYDSSLYPVRRPGYGYPGGQRDVHALSLAAGVLLEVPPTTLRIGGANLPAAGGGTFRHFPFRFTRAAFREQGRVGASPGTFYLHPWELDPEQPRIPGMPWLTRLRHYGGLHRTADRLRRLLGEFRFQPIADALELGRGR